MIFDIIMYIYVGLIIVTLCIAFIKMIYDEIKYKKLIGQDLSNYDIKELVKLLEIYERIFKSHILYKDKLFGEEAGRIRVEFEKRINNKNDISDFDSKVLFENYSKEAERIRTAFEKLTNNKNDIKNMIVFDPKGEPYNDFKKEIVINKEQIEQLKVIVNIAVSIENYYSKFIRNVFRYIYNTKKSLFKKTMLNKNEYNFLFYISDCLHNIPEIIEVSLQIINEENKLDFIPTIYPLVSDEIKCLKNIINISDSKTRKEMKINDDNRIKSYLIELNRMSVLLDALILNIQIFIDRKN